MNPEQLKQMDAAKMSNARRIIDELPKIEEQALRQLELSDKLSKKNQQIELELAAKTEKVEQLEVAMVEANHELKFSQEAAELARKQSKEWEETLRRQTEIDNPKRPWNLKRLVWAGLSSCAGVATAFFLRKRVPMLNAASGGCAFGNVIGKIPGCKDHALIGSATGALTTHWAHQQENLVGMSVETILAGAGYAELTFNVGEALVDRSVEAFQALKEGYQETKEKLKGEGGTQ